MAYRQIFTLILALYIFSRQMECHPFQSFDNFGNVYEGVLNRLTKEFIIQLSDLDQSNSKVQDADNFIIDGANELINANAKNNGAESELQNVLKAVQNGDEPISAAAKEFKKDMLESSTEA
ncbi:hypothetical protein AVEN_130311-1 [Araneus ventricosus]|uniref:Uncharacterized protein n=1 Tax=Araneus ventricosus TaxID=182803 RepID=A0A4Y2BEK4_ARAVE|nr:hypothetical protein AVEN_130311-1 [Araneus ventricosus]